MQKKRSSRFALIAVTLLTNTAGFGWLGIGADKGAAQAQTLEGGVQNIRALIERGNALMARQQFQAAVDAYQKVLDLEPNNQYAKTNIVLAHNNWGIFHFRKGEYELAKGEWDKALSIDANDRNAKNNIAVLKRTLAKAGKSLDDLGKENAPAKSEEKKKEEAAAAPPPSVVLLTPQKKQDASGSTPTENSKPTSYSEQDTQPTGAGAVIISTPAAGTPASSASSLATPAPVTPAPATEPPPPPTRSKAQDEADAFRRMTSPNSSNAGYGSSPPPNISTFRAVPRRNNGSPSSFFDDTGAPPDKQAPPQFEQTEASQEPAARSAPAQTTQTPAYSSQPDDSVAEEKTQHKKKHGKSQAADAANQWKEGGSPPLASVESSAAMGNVDSSLAKLEMKIYGQPRPQPSVLKRLERMEVDSFGRSGMGSITERIDKLKKMYNVLD